MTSENLLLALGNDLLGDDGVGILAARAVRKRFSEDELDVIETGEAGLALMELMTGYKRCLIIDSVQTTKVPPGTTIEFMPDDFRKVIAPSPHYAGLPEVFSTAEHFGIELPEDVQILAMEVANPFDFADHFTPGVEAGFPEYVERITEAVSSWK